jgi:hypothetical protein
MNTKKKKDMRHAGKNKAAEPASIATAPAMTQMPRLRVANGGVSIFHADSKTGERILMERFRTKSPAFVWSIIKQMANVAAKGKQPDEDELNLMLSFVIDAEPIDQFHTMLLTQAAANHVLIMHYGNYVGSSDSIYQQDSGGRILINLIRTFMLQMATSKHYRGQQNRREEPVEVQAVAPLAITDARAIPMEPLQQPERIPIAPKEKEPEE